MLLLYVYGCFVRIYVCTSHACLVLQETRRKHQISGITGGCKMSLWVLGINLGSLAVAASAVNY